MKVGYVGGMDGWMVVCGYTDIDMYRYRIKQYVYLLAFTLMRLHGKLHARFS